MRFTDAINEKKKANLYYLCKFVITKIEFKFFLLNLQETDKLKQFKLIKRKQIHLLSVDPQSNVSWAGRFVLRHEARLMNLQLHQGFCTQAETHVNLSVHQDSVSIDPPLKE